MKKLQIHEVIVVEGKHDQARCQELVDAEIVITNGTHISLKMMELLKVLQAKRGVIVFTDQDTPGNMIRQSIHQKIPDVKHAVLTRKQTKPGVEHAEDQMILDALMAAKPLIKKGADTLSKADFIDLGLSGQSQSQSKRKQLADKLHLPISNAKQMFKYLNMLSITKKDIETLL
jgi:ribonuclease M5